MGENRREIFGAFESRETYFPGGGEAILRQVRLQLFLEFFVGRNVLSRFIIPSYARENIQIPNSHVDDSTVKTRRSNRGLVSDGSAEGFRYFFLIDYSKVFVFLKKNSTRRVSHPPWLQPHWILCTQGTKIVLKMKRKMLFQNHIYLDPKIYPENAVIILFLF